MAGLQFGFLLCIVLKYVSSSESLFDSTLPFMIFRPTIDDHSIETSKFTMFTNVSVVENVNHNIHRVNLRDNPATFCTLHHKTMSMTVHECIYLFLLFQASPVLNVEFSEVVQLRLKIKGVPDPYFVSLDLQTSTPQQEATTLCVSLLKPKIKCGKAVIKSTDFDKCVSAVNTEIWRQVEAHFRKETFDAMLRVRTAHLTRDMTLLKFTPLSEYLRSSATSQRVDESERVGDLNEFIWKFIQGLSVRVGVLLISIVVLRSVFEFLWF